MTAVAAKTEGRKLRPMNGYYVYFLIDPRDGSTFYVGKGKGGRIRQHVAEVRAGRYGSNGAKCERIREIITAGMAVVEQIHRGGLTEDEAYELERRLIKGMDGLTNIISGTVTARQSAAARMRVLIASLKTFDEWIVTTDQRILAQARSAFGDLREFYDRFRAEITSDLDWIEGR